MGAITKFNPKKNVIELLTACKIQNYLMICIKMKEDITKNDTDL